MFEGTISVILSVLMIICMTIVGMYAGYVIGLRKKINTLTNGYVEDLELEVKRLKSER